MNTRRLWFRRLSPARKSHSSLLLSATIALAFWLALASPLTVNAANSIAVRIICNGVFVQNAEVKLYRIGANGERQVAGEALTDQKGKARITNFDSGTYELQVVCSGGPPNTYKFTVGAGQAFSHSYSFRCCPPGDRGPNGLSGVDGRFPTEEEQGNATLTKPTMTAANGLKTVTFYLERGEITVRLPDDMRAGDTISGTVVAEPKGETPEQRETNKAELKIYAVALFPADPPAPKTPPLVIFDLSLGAPQSGGSLTVPGTFTAPTKANVGLFLMPNENAPVGPCGRSGSLVAINESCSPISQLIFEIQPRSAPPIIPTTVPDPIPTFVIPIVGQSGRPLVIPGPFDGNSSNTDTDFQPTVSEALSKQPFLGGWTDMDVIAESPRNIIVVAPVNIVGPLQIRVKEGTAQTIGPFRNVGVTLSAPKTSLVKGEPTTLTVEVKGLQDLRTPVPLTLDSRGVITMEGGMYQPLMIQPSQVSADGRYTTTRGITGVQAGSWTSTATVVTRRLNFCLQDDTAPERRILWNTLDGEYSFSWPSPGQGSATGATQSGGTNSPAGLSGKGTIKMKGCIITLQHNAPDRRVMATLDPCTSSGSSTIEDPKTKTKFTITDRNIADNTCPN